MIRQRNTIKKSIPSDSLIPSDQILISIIDAIVSVSLFSVGLALIIGDKPKAILVVGLLLLSVAGLYLLLKNTIFRSLGCMLKKANYTCDDSKTGKLWVRVLLHNLVSLSPFIGLIVFQKMPYVLYFVLLIYLLNFIGYKTDNRRIIDVWLRIMIRRKATEESNMQ